MEFKSGGSSSSAHRRPQQPDGASLPRQGSVYSLTFDEFQSALGGGPAGGGSGVGKDFGSMNMDELLRNIWTAEETHAMTSASTAGPGAPPAPLQRQGSSLTLPRTLSAKTVDEVWRNLVREESPLEGAPGGGQQAQQRQSTLGEMTLEEFLVKAGVVRDNVPLPALPPMPPPPRPVPVAPKSAAFFGNFPGADDAAAAAALGFAPVGMGHLAMANGLMPPRAAGMGGGALAVQTAANHLDPGGMGNSDLSSPNEPLPYAFQGMIRGRRNGAGVEKVVERRQRRMIKNRESAARSRERKQAYTMELEAEVQKLKEQNKELQRKQEEMKESQNNEIPEILKDPFGQNKRLCLRRTSTGPW